MKVIARHQENITLNPYEFVCEPSGEVKVFRDDDEAINFINENSDVKQDKQQWDNEGIYILEYADYFN